MNTSERLKIVRGELTQAEFASTLEIHKNTLGRYERGESVPDSDVCAKICSVFGVSPAWLLLGIGPMKEEGEKRDSATDNETLRATGGATSPMEWGLTKLEQELELEKGERRELAAENRRLYREKEELHREKELLLREKEELLRTLGELSTKLALMEGRLEAARGETEQEEPPLRFDKKQAIPSSSHTLPTYK